MENERQNLKTAVATLKYLKIAPRKTRFLAEVIKGLPVNEAQAQLMLSTKRASQPLLKLLRSAIANAKQVHKAAEDKLYVKEIRVDQGPKFKRWMPRARGAVSPIEKKTSQVRLVLGLRSESQPSRFSFPLKKAKKTKKSKPAKAPAKDFGGKKEKPVSEKGSKEESRKGFLKRIFRRKSV